MAALHGTVVASLARSSRATRRPLALLIILFSPSLLGEDLSLALASGTGSTGATVSLPVTFAGSDTAVSALQWTLSYPPQAFVSVEALTGPSATDAAKSLTCMQTVGSITCLVIGANTNFIARGIVATVSFQISPRAELGDSQIQLTGLAAASPAGDPVPVTATGGTITIKPSRRRR